MTGRGLLPLCSTLGVVACVCEHTAHKRS